MERPRIPERCLLDMRRKCPVFCGLNEEAKLNMDIIEEVILPKTESVEDFIANIDEIDEREMAFIVMNQMGALEENGTLRHCIEYTKSELRTKD